MNKNYSLCQLGLLVIALLIFSNNSNAQISAGRDTIVCSTPVTLTAIATPNKGTTNYKIDTIPYDNSIAYNTGDSVLKSDIINGDSWRGSTKFFPIGFTFCFFGEPYTQFVVGTQGWIGFSTGQTRTRALTSIPNNTGKAPMNAILGAWFALDGIGDGSVRYEVYGTAPYRKLAVTFNNLVPNCDAAHGWWKYNSKIVLYETTNIIENFIDTMEMCQYPWNTDRDDGITRGVQGLHDKTGTKAVTVSGRNYTQWSSGKEGIRYTPDGPGPLTVNWYKSGDTTVLATGKTDTLQVSVSPPSGSTDYVAEVIYDCPSATYTDTVNVTVKTVSATISAGNDTSICKNDSVQLNLSGSGTIRWSPATGLSDTTIAKPYAKPLTTTTYIVSVSGGCAGSGSDTITVTVNDPPVVDAGDSIAICKGVSTALSTTTVFNSYSWTPTSTLTTPALQTTTATPTVTTTYTVQVTDTKGCKNKDSVLVTVNDIAIVDAGANTSVCIGKSATLSATAGFITYSWKPITGLGTPSGQSTSATPAVTTTYTVTASSGGSCIATDTVTITVNPLPTVNAGADDTICKGNNLTLNPATGLSKYVWSPASLLSSADTIANSIANPVVTTSYTLTATNGNGCVNTDTVKITVDSVSVTASADTSVCSGSSASLSASGTGTSYSWTPTLTLTTPDLQTTSAKPAAITTYTVTASNAAGCSAKDSVIVTIKPLPTIDNVSTNYKALCLGSPFTLKASGTEVSSYSWSSLTIPDTGTTVRTTPTQIGSYYYKVIALNACGSDSDSVAVKVLVNPTVDIGADTTICKEESILLNSTTTGNVTTYLWTPSQGLSDTTAATPIATPEAATTYIVQVYNEGCFDYDTITISVNAPKADFSRTPEMGTAPLSVAFVNNSTVGAYQWFLNETPAYEDKGAAHSFTSKFTSSGTYNVRLVVTDSNGCEADTMLPVMVSEMSILWIPNAFTPKGDNINDRFSVVASPGITNLKVTIFDRWGELIYEWTDINGGWDGTYKGELAQEGVYVYILSATDSDKSYQKVGHVTLLRQEY